jgi:hypothetical protein
VAGARLDVTVAVRTHVPLVRLVGLQEADIDLPVGLWIIHHALPKKTHTSKRTPAMIVAPTNT